MVRKTPCLTWRQMCRQVIWEQDRYHQLKPPEERLRWIQQACPVRDRGTYPHQVWGQEIRAWKQARGLKVRRVVEREALVNDAGAEEIDTGLFAMSEPDEEETAR